MELHKDLNVYVGFVEGGCTDVATIKLKGYTLVSDEELAELIEKADKYQCFVKKEVL